jgi:hypothetical protein
MDTPKASETARGEKTVVQGKGQHPEGVAQEGSAACSRFLSDLALLSVKGKRSRRSGA